MLMTSIFFSIFDPLLLNISLPPRKEITDVSRFYLFHFFFFEVPALAAVVDCPLAFMNKIFFEAGVLTVQKHKCPKDFLIFWLHIELFNQLLILFKCSFWFAAKLNPREKRQTKVIREIKSA